MAIGTHRASLGRTSRSYPLPLLAYIALSIAILLYLTILPGDPSFTGGLPWSWLAIHGGLIFFVLRRSPSAWLVLVLIEFLVIVALVFLTAWPWSLKLWGLIALQLCAMLALLAPGARRYVWDRPRRAVSSRRRRP